MIINVDMMIPSHDGFFPIHFAKDALSNDDFNEIVEYLKHRYVFFSVT